MQIQYTKNFNPSLLLTAILKAISCNLSALGLLETLQKCQAVPQYVRCGKIAGLNNCNLARAGKRFFSLLSTPICWLVFLQSSPIWLLEFITGSIFTPNAPINVNPVAGGWGSGGKGRGFDAWDYSPVGLLIVRSDPGVGTFDFHRQKPGIDSEAVTKSVPRGFLKVTLLEKGVKFSFVLIAIIRYFKLSSKQIMSILRKFLSSSSKSDCKTRLKSNSTMKVRRFFTGHCSDMLSRCYKAFYVSLIL